MSKIDRRVLVIGLDSAEPSLVFERWRKDLPNLSRLMSHGVYGRLESSHPPITVPAWTSMLASRDPGQLGFYGFRNRANYSYDDLRIANSTAVQVPRVWDVLGAVGKRSILVGVPQTYPVRPINGYVISDFLTPPNPQRWTHPEMLASEVTEFLGGEAYEFDVRQFRTADKSWLLDSIYQMTRKRWELLLHLIENKPWDFFMFVEMGIDRIQHGFWRYMDPDHFLFEAGSPFEAAIHDYYAYLDNQIGRMLTKVGAETIVMIVSDHGARRMDGGFCVNEWLKRRGYLVLREEPVGIAKLNPSMVDWSRTRAWGDGGYYARIFMNVAGREPQGTILAEDYEAERDRLRADLEATLGPDAQPLGTIALKPQDVYREVNGIAPDLIVYFGALSWRSVGTIGHSEVYTRENDTGPDDANHSQHGLVIIHDPLSPAGGQELTGPQVECVGPTILDFLHVEKPSSMMGKPILIASGAMTVGVPSAGGSADGDGRTEESGYSPEEEASVSERLASLGYL